MSTRRKNQWDDFKVVGTGRPPSRGTPGHLLLVLVLVGILGFGIGAGGTAGLIVASESLNRQPGELQIDPPFTRQHFKWFVLAGGALGAISLMSMVWQYWPKDTDEKSPWRFLGLGAGNRRPAPQDTHWSKIHLPDWPWLPPRGTPGHLLIVLTIWCVLGFMTGAGLTLLRIATELEDMAALSWPLQSWVRWAMLGGGIAGGALAVLAGWKRYPKDLN